MSPYFDGATVFSDNWDCSGVHARNLDIYLGISLSITSNPVTHSVVFIQTLEHNILNCVLFSISIKTNTPKPSSSLQDSSHSLLIAFPVHRLSPRNLLSMHPPEQLIHITWVTEYAFPTNSVSFFNPGNFPTIISTNTVALYFLHFLHLEILPRLYPLNINFKSL